MVGTLIPFLREDGVKKPRCATLTCSTFLPNPQWNNRQDCRVFEGDYVADRHIASGQSLEKGTQFGRQRLEHQGTVQTAHFPGKDIAYTGQYVVQESSLINESW